MRLGVCWYPEQWPREQWEEDAALMADIGLRVVRIGEFAWSHMEPERDRFDWEWLDHVIDLLHRHDLEVVLGTPTATPPVWLMRERPDVLSVGPEGRRRAYGSRRHTCPTSAAYREEARRITTALAERYGRHPAVTAWQVDNEPGNHDSARCWCEACQDAFGRWLGDRFDGSIDALNEAWGTAFWSQRYDSFDDVVLPVPTMTKHNPGLLLAHLRFASHQAVASLREQVEVLRALAPEVPTFTNLYNGDVDIDGQAVGRLHALGAMDSYPHGVRDHEDVGFLLDLARGSSLQPGEGADALGGRGWVVEQQPGAINWTTHNAAVPAGQVRLWGWQAALHGIDTLLFFRWRAARRGQEQYHTGLLRHDRLPDQCLAEARRLAGELADVEPAMLARPVARVALVYDYDDAWALDLDPHVQGLTHRELVIAAHAGARRLGLDVDVVPMDADLSTWEVVLAPALHTDAEGKAAKLLRAANAGTAVVLGPRSLVKDDENGWTDRSLPGVVADHVGARIVEWGHPGAWPRRSDTALPHMALGSRSAPAGAWTETFEVVGDAEVIAVWEGGTHRDGRPAAVRREGVTLLGAASPEAWCLVVAELLGLSPPSTAEPVEIVQRDGRTVLIDHGALTLDLGS